MNYLAKMKHLYSPLLFALLALPALAEDFKNVEYVRAYDADTITVDVKGIPAVFGDDIGIRVAGVDTPEIRGKCAAEKKLAIKARDRVRGLLESANTIDLLNVERGKYFRLVARVEIDGTDLSQLLLKEGYAVEYDGGKKTNDWCEE